MQPPRGLVKARDNPLATNAVAEIRLLLCLTWIWVDHFIPGVDYDPNGDSGPKRPKAGTLNKNTS